jgi:hypothetical protein
MSLSDINQFKIRNQKALDYYNSELSLLDKDDELYIKEHIRKYDYLDGNDIITIRRYIEKAKAKNQKMKVVKELSNFLSAKEYGKGTKIPVVFLDAGKIEEGKFGKVYHFEAECGEKREIKTISLSGKNFNEVIDKLGDETEQWIGAGIIMLVVASDKAQCGKSLQVI